MQNALLDYRNKNIFRKGIKGLTQVTGIGLVVDLFSDSAERSELVQMVNENKIKDGNKLVDFEEYKQIYSELEKLKFMDGKYHPLPKNQKYSIKIILFRDSVNREIHVLMKVLFTEPHKEYESNLNILSKTFCNSNISLSFC